MKERPILFQGAMIRALLAGTKTQTRRAIKPQPWGQLFRTTAGEWRRGSLSDDPTIIKCPYGQPGDRLWVREAWRVGAWNMSNFSIAVDYVADGCARREWLPVAGEIYQRLHDQSAIDALRAGIEYGAGGYKWRPGDSPCRQRPSIHMPRAVCRLLLEITDVRVARVQAITEADALAEGVTGERCDHSRRDCDEVGCPGPSAVASYRALWDSINGAGSWQANPWVWVVEFRRVIQ